MTVTIKLNPLAVWDDGTAITSRDLECTYRAFRNTPGSLWTDGYDKIRSIDSSDPQTAVVMFSEPYAAYKDLFGMVLKADALTDCDDISGDLLDCVPFSGGPWRIESWSDDRLVLVPNEKYWVHAERPIARRVVVVPTLDGDAEIDSLRSGEVGMIFPQTFPGVIDMLEHPNIRYTPGYSNMFEGLYFQQLDGPFADPVFRKAFSMSVDRELILSCIYDCMLPGSELLQCGLWVPTVGKWCQDGQFSDSYDPVGAARLLTENGWAKTLGGFWAKDGRTPSIRWMVNTGNLRREDTQALMVPELAAKGFDVVADNADSDTVFQVRLPALDYDLTMFINTAWPNPSVTAFMSCEQIPSAGNDHLGQNILGWCNQEASALMARSDREINEDTRVDLIHKIGQYLVDDAVMLPLYQFSSIVAWRTDKVTGPVDQWADNYMGPFKNLNKWRPVGGTEIVIGAEQWPDILNPVTEWAWPWLHWIAVHPVYPAVWQTTVAGHAPTDLVVDEPMVTLG